MELGSNSADVIICAPRATPRAMSDLGISEAESITLPATIPDISNVMADPFAAFNWGSEHEVQYLSDAEVRLSNCDLWNVNTTAELRRLIGQVQDSPQIHARLEDMTHKMQHSMTNKVFPFRNQIWDMARTLWETLIHSRSGDDDLVQECNVQLDAVLVQISNQFQIQHKLLTEICEDQHVAMLKHVHAADVADHSAMTRSKGSQFLWACGGLSLSTLLLGLVSPRMLLATGFASHLRTEWFATLPLESQNAQMTHENLCDAARAACLIKRNEVNISDKASESRNGQCGLTLVATKVESHWAVILVGVGLASLFVGSLCYGASHCYRKQAGTEDLFVKGRAFQKLNAQQNQRMWEGMNMCVENLQASVRELQNLNARRKDRRECIFQDIGWRLFAMSMAVDEYIVWLSERDSFPANFSVRSALQPSRYDKIKSVFDAVKASAPLTGCSMEAGIPEAVCAD